MYGFNAILTQALATEWRVAVGRLPPALAELLQLPQFAVNTEMQCWGQWRGGKIGRIELKSELIRRHPWYAVVDVLRHEIAHQVCEICYPDTLETAHGPNFRQVCAMLGARAEASGEYPPLDQQIFAEEDDGSGEGATNPQARLTVKIRKLLSLSGSANENEARSALLKARELEAKYAIDLENAPEGAADAEAFYTITIGVPQRRISMEGSLTGSILQEFFHVLVIWETVPNLNCGDREAGGNCKQLCLSGTRKDLKIASYVYDCIISYMRHALYELPAELLGRALTLHKASQEFNIGVLTGFQNAMREQNQRPEMRALVKCDQTRLKEYFERAYPRLRHVASSYHGSDARMRAAGEAAGRRFTLRHGLDSRGKLPRQLQ